MPGPEARRCAARLGLELCYSKSPMKLRPSLLPTSLDAVFCDVVDRVATRVLGRADVQGAALTQALTSLSEAYTGARRGSRGPIELRHTSNEEALAARARFFFVRDLPKIAGPLDELRVAKKLPPARAWRVLDVGAGLGAMSFGVAHFAKVHDLADRIEVLAIDHDARALSFMKEMASEVSRSLSKECVETQIETRSLDVTSADAFASLGEFDLIVMGFTLNELFENLSEDEARKKRVAVLHNAMKALRSTGSLIVLEPALRDVARSLERVRDELVTEKVLTVFAPCIRRSTPCPMLENERDWCHESIPYALPERTAALARDAGLRFEGLSFSYLTLRKDGARLRDFVGTDSAGTAAKAHFRMVSEALPSKGKHEAFGCGDPGRVRLMLLLREAAESNDSFFKLERGDLFALEPGTDPASQVVEIKHRISKLSVLTLEKPAGDPLRRRRSL
jgi:SAM-dependent methyltransferase